MTSGPVVGVGLDLVDIARFSTVLGRRPALAERLFCEDEREGRAGTLAGRFAAKEAVMKALGVGLGAVDWSDICVRRRPGGAPELTVTGRAAGLAARRGVRAWHLTISHTAATAAAVVVATG